MGGLVSSHLPCQHPAWCYLSPGSVGQAATLKGLTRGSQTSLQLISHWADLGHMGMSSCKGSWEMWSPAGRPSIQIKLVGYITKRKRKRIDWGGGHCAMQKQTTVSKYFSNISQMYRDDL